MTAEQITARLVELLGTCTCRRRTRVEDESQEEVHVWLSERAPHWALVHRGPLDAAAIEAEAHRLMAKLELGAGREAQREDEGRGEIER